MDPSGFEVPFLVTLLAVLAWIHPGGPLRHLVRVTRAFWFLSRSRMTEERDLLEYAPARPVSARVPLAALLAAGLLGLTLTPTTVEFYPPRTPADEALFHQFNPGGSNGVCVTGSVAGFPWRGIEGCSFNAAWSMGVSLTRSSFAAWFDYGCFLLVGALVSFVVPQRWLRVALVVAGAVAVLGTAEGWSWLQMHRD